MPVLDLTVPMLGLSPRVHLWQGGPITAAGKITAIDTETLLIDFDKPSEYPDVVVLTAYGGGDIVDLVTWEYIPEYMERLLATKTILSLHNAPFDFGVLGMDQFVPHIDAGLVNDTGLQWVLRRLSTRGLSDTDKLYPGLAMVIRDLFGVSLVKDSGVRCTFSRDVPLDNEHIVYACGDAIATWRAAMLMGYQPTMDIQVQGFITLDLISRLGMLVDQDYMRETRNIQQRTMDKEASKLASWGIRTDKDPESSEVFEEMQEVFELKLPYASAQVTPLAVLRGLLHKTLQSSSLDEVSEWLSSGAVPGGDPATLLPFSSGPVTKRQAYGCLWRALNNLKDGLSPMDGLQEYWESHQGWPPGYKQKSGQAAMLDLMTEAEKRLGVVFPRTKNGKISTSEEALQAIPDDQVSSMPFLDSWKKYKYAEHMVSTYLTPKIIKPDGRVHTRFCPIMATGRTSSRDPNVQNLPRDERMRDHYIADTGYVINSCDYNQQELIALAQDCYTCYGYSRMRDIINNGIDLHGYVGTKIDKRLEHLPPIDPDDKDLIKAYKDAVAAFKKEDKKHYNYLKKLSKALNFGLPGGLGPKTFITYAKGYGVTIGFEEAQKLCNLWKDTFPEMKQHLSPQPMLDAPDKYQVRTLSGRLRVHASFCAACNTKFQGLAADISKAAGWALIKEGFALCCFIHDEYLALIPYNRHITARALHMQHIMERVMAKFTPDVRCKAEPTLMFRWSKAAELWLDGEGDITPWELVPKKDDDGDLVPRAWDELGANEKTAFLDRKKRLWDAFPE